MHPADLRECSFLGIEVHCEFLTGETKRLEVLDRLLRGIRRTSEAASRWEEVAVRAGAVLKGTCRVEAAAVSPDRKKLAVCLWQRTWLGLRTHYVGMLYDLGNGAICGRVVRVKRDGGGNVTMVGVA